MTQANSLELIPPTKPFIPPQDREWILKQIDDSLATGQLTMGRFTELFEKEFAEQMGVPYALAVNSGTSALEIVLRILNVEGKEVIVPTNTFFATAAAVKHAGGIPRFADIHPQTLCLGMQDLKNAITPKTAGVILVHIGGMMSPDTEEMVQFCRQNGLFILEDAAHAHGSRLNGKAAGAWGIAGCFSLYPTKVMTSAEGGMISTSDKTIVEEAKIYRDQGKTSLGQNHHVRLGYNWRMSEIHAIIGLSQLRRLKSFIEHRTALARLYDRLLKDQPGICPQVIPQNITSAYYKYIAFLDTKINRPQLKQHLREKFKVILGSEVYEIPLHRQPIFQSHSEGAFPNAERATAEHICLPLFSSMTEQQAKNVAEVLCGALSQYSKNGGFSQ